MAGSRAPGATTGSIHIGPDRRRWWVLVVVAVCQLLVVLSASVVNIALPQMQQALDISDANRPWVVTAYTPGVGGLLLLGGRIADFVGRRKVLVTGLVGFAVASGLGGLAGNAAVLFAGRGAPRVFAALVTPAALSLLSGTFVDPRERATAFGVHGAMSGGGGAVGLVVGGVLTEYASWRWCLLLNVPVAVAAALLAQRLAMLSASAGLLRMFLFLSYYLQGTLGYSALAVGVAFLPLSLSTVVATASSLAGRPDPAVAAVHGYQVALPAGAVVLGVGAIGAAFLVRDPSSGT